MTQVNRWAEFRADFPDDQIGEGDGVVQSGGKAVAETIAGMLRSFGCKVDELFDEVMHGWMCDFAHEGLALRFQVVDLADHYLLIFEEPHRATRDYYRYGDALTKLNEHVRRD